MAHDGDVGDDVALDGHLHGDGPAIAGSRGGIHAVPVGGRRSERLHDRRFSRFRLGRGRVVDDLAGQCVLHGPQDAAGSVGSLRDSVHLPGLRSDHGVQQPPGALEESGRLVGGVQDLNAGDGAILHGHLHLHRPAVAPRRAGVDAVGVRQPGQHLFFRHFLHSGFAGGLHRRGQTFRDGCQDRFRVRQGEEYRCRHGSGRDELHQRAQRLEWFHRVSSSDMENKAPPCRSGLVLRPVRIAPVWRQADFRF